MSKLAEVWPRCALLIAVVTTAPVDDFTEPRELIQFSYGNSKGFVNDFYLFLKRKLSSFYIDRS